MTACMADVLVPSISCSVAILWAIRPVCPGSRILGCQSASNRYRPIGAEQGPPWGLCNPLMDASFALLVA